MLILDSAQVPALAESIPAEAEPEAQVAPKIQEQPEEPLQTRVEEAPADLGCAPPAVSVSFGGASVDTEEPKAASRSFTPEKAQVRILAFICSRIQCWYILQKLALELPDLLLGQSHCHFHSVTSCQGRSMFVMKGTGAQQSQACVCCHNRGRRAGG